MADTLCADRCVACGDCLERTPGLPLAAPAGLCRGCAGSVIPLPTLLCLDCPPHLDPLRCRRSRHLRVKAAVQYGDAIAALVRAAKYDRRPALIGVWLRIWVAARGRLSLPDSGDVIVPIPSHPARVRERGFDPGEEWAILLAQHQGLPLARCLRRQRATRQQVGQNRRRRTANVAGAFAPGPDWTVARRQRVILVDDVVTTGATAREAAGVLLSGGATAVTVWCFAFEPLE